MNAKWGTSGGNRLRALREYYGRTQLDVELDAQLGIGYLQRVESGKVRQPERDTLERILVAFKARYTERRDVLELFGYIVDAPLPNEQDIQWAISGCHAELDNAVFPAYLLDCGHRLLYWNELASQVFLTCLQYQVSMLKVVFDPSYQILPKIINRDQFLPAQIRALRYEMQHFHNETWYETLMQDMHLCDAFQSYWSLENGREVHIPARPLSPLELEVKGKMMSFRLISEPFAQDRRFRVIFYLPANAETIQQCISWFHRNVTST